MSEPTATIGRRSTTSSPKQPGPVSPPHSLRRTRAASVWTALGVAMAFLVVLIVFIAQNGRQTDITFVVLHAHVGVGFALLIAAVGGGVVVGLAGSVRIVQLRRTAGRHRRANNASEAAMADRPSVKP